MRICFHSDLFHEKLMITGLFLTLGSKDGGGGEQGQASSRCLTLRSYVLMVHPTKGGSARLPTLRPCLKTLISW